MTVRGPVPRTGVDLTLFQIALLLLGASAVGALLPLYPRWSERGLHLFVALAAGIFLGTIFLHFLPHLAGGEDHAGHDHGPLDVAHGGGLWPWIAAMCGLLLLFAIEKVWLPSWTRTSSANPHTVLWTATFVGLALHAVTAGFALSAVFEHSEGRTQLLVSLLIHKATETFSLATVMRLAQLSRGRMLSMLTLFALLEPAGLFLGRELLVSVPWLDVLLTGFAAGTFLYVATCDLLPEVFHGQDRPRLKLFAVVAGIGVTAITVSGLERLGGFARDVGHASWDFFLDLAPFLLIGLLVAALVRLLLQRVRLARHIAGNDLKSVLWAALFGAPLPLCSCSVVPVAVSLRRAGASKGATSAFAISTPETGVDSVAVSFVLLDPVLAIARPIGAIVSAVVSGLAVNALVRAKWDESPPSATEDAAVPTCSHDHGHDHDHGPRPALGHAHTHGHGHGHGHAHALAPRPRAAVAEAPILKIRAAKPATETTPRDTDTIAAVESSVAHVGTPLDGVGERAPWRRAFRYAYVEMLDDLTVSLVSGILLSGVIFALLPDHVLETPMTTGFGALLLMLVVGIPLYVCALTSTPIAAALMLKGLSPGAAFVFLLAGPATNAAALFMFSKVLGKRVVIVQVAALSVSVVAMGWFVDRLYPWLGRVPHANPGDVGEHTASWIAIPSAVVLGLLLIASLIRTHGRRDLLAGLRDAPGTA